jgi:hypothetical protein
MAQARTQSNAMLYALITFVALFIVGVVCAIVFYVKSEEYRTQLENNRAETLKIANIREQGALGKIVGKTEPPATYLGTLSDFYNKLITVVTGVVQTEDVSADVKFNDITLEIEKLGKLLGSDMSPAVGPDGVALITLINDLKAKLDDARSQQSDAQAQYQQLQVDFNAAKEECTFKEQQLVEQVQTYQTNADEIQAKYDELKNQMDASADEQLQAANKRLEEEQNKLRQKQMELTDTQTKMAEMDKSLKEALAKLESIRPRPDRDVAAYQADASLLRVDLQNGLVYLNIGSEDHVYRGLTFAVFDRNMPIPESGEGKAEVEVFQVEPKVSVARIVKGTRKNPIVKEDLVANLIWDSKTANRFVVLGDFDFNNDGKMDSDGNQRIRDMIEHWGGVVQNEVTIDTDFVVVGGKPKPMARPEQAAVDLDPSLQQKYEDSIKSAQVYQSQLDTADTLSTPVFNQKRFLYLIGYDGLLATKAAN